jgi:hypothetical protein
VKAGVAQAETEASLHTRRRLRYVSLRALRLPSAHITRINDIIYSPDDDIVG